MRTALLLTVITFAFVGCTSEKGTPPATQPGGGAASVGAAGAAVASAATLEVACAKCVYKQAGVAGCEAAVKLGDKVLLLSAPGFDAHKEGLCAGAKQATITGGKEEGGKYVASKVELVK